MGCPSGQNLYRFSLAKGSCEWTTNWRPCWFWHLSGRFWWLCRLQLHPWTGQNDPGASAQALCNLELKKKVHQVNASNAGRNTVNINKWLIYEWSIYINQWNFIRNFYPWGWSTHATSVRWEFGHVFNLYSFMGFEETFTKHWPPTFSLNFCSLQVFNLANIGMIKLIKLIHIYPSNCLFRSFNLACQTSMWMMQWFWYHGHRFTSIISCDLVFRCFTSGSGQAESTSSCVGNSSFRAMLYMLQSFWLAFGLGGLG